MKNNHLKKHLLIAFFFLFINFLFSPNFAQAIVNGQKEKASSPIAQSTVGIYNEMTEMFCSGTIIDLNWIVTAAHCLSKNGKTLSGDIEAKNVVIIFGNFNIASGDTNFKAPTTQASFLLKHPGYGGMDKIRTAERNDVALIRFDPKAMPKNFKAASILSKANFFSIRPGCDVIISGFGVTSLQDKSDDKDLYSFATTFQFTDPDLAVARLVPHENRLGGNCPGDSGGGAFVEIGGQTYLWGVASTAEASCMKFGEYGNLTHYEAWIDQAMKKI